MAQLTKLGRLALIGLLATSAQYLNRDGKQLTRKQQRKMSKRAKRRAAIQRQAWLFSEERFVLGIREALRAGANRG